MMTNGPSATIGEILQVDLERPRKRVELASDARYNHYRHAVLAFLYERQRKVEDLLAQKNHVRAYLRPGCASLNNSGIPLWGILLFHWGQMVKRNRGRTSPGWGQ
jgi:hypothetical protein